MAAAIQLSYDSIANRWLSASSPARATDECIASPPLRRYWHLESLCLSLGSNFFDYPNSAAGPTGITCQNVFTAPARHAGSPGFAFDRASMLAAYRSHPCYSE